MAGGDFELRLLLEQVEQQQIVGIALLAHVAELLAHLPAAYSSQRLKLSTKLQRVGFEPRMRR